MGGSFLKLGNTLRNSHGEIARPKLDASLATAPESAVDDDCGANATIPMKQNQTRRRGSSMAGGGRPLDLSPQFSGGSPK